jgi:cyclophilin family peptidyl-prolyl cis-trans isomerase
VRKLLGIGLALAALAVLPCSAQQAADDTPPSMQALRAHRASTPSSMLDGAPASAWRTLDPDDTLYVNLPQGRVVIELAPQFAPHYVANIKKLVRQGYFNGLPIFRVQDNAVAEWGDPTGRKSVGLARRTVAAEFERPLRGLPFTALPDPDTYAPQVGFSDGFPAARDPVFGRAWLANCYGMVGTARGNNVDSGGGTALYAIIGGPQRQWDRNTTMVGRVVTGMPLLSSLARGTGPQGAHQVGADRRGPARRQAHAARGAAHRYADLFAVRGVAAQSPRALVQGTRRPHQPMQHSDPCSLISCFRPRAAGHALAAHA